MTRYSSLDDLISDLDHESILDDTILFDDEDLELLSPGHRRAAESAKPAPKKRGRPKRSQD